MVSSRFVEGLARPCTKRFLRRTPRRLILGLGHQSSSPSTSGLDHPDIVFGSKTRTTPIGAVQHDPTGLRRPAVVA